MPHATVNALVLALALCLVAPVAAQTVPTDPDPVLPELYAVSGVAADDTLNIRTRPGTDGAIIGELAPDAANIEVVRLSDDGRWARINRGEQAGWVSLRFLRRQEQAISDDLLDRPLACHGNEPFWDLGLDGIGQAAFSDFNVTDAPVTLRRNWFTREPFTAGGMEMAEFSDGNFRFNIGLRRVYCSDTMSDFDFGIKLIGILTTPTGPVHYSGCCTLETRP